MYTIIANIPNAVLEKGIDTPQINIGISMRRETDNEPKWFDSKIFCREIALQFMHRNFIMTPVVIQYDRNTTEQNILDVKINLEDCLQSSKYYDSNIEINGTCAYVHAHSNRYINAYNSLVFREEYKKRVLTKLDAMFGIRNIDLWQEESEAYIDENFQALMNLKILGLDFHLPYHYGYECYVNNERDFVDIYDISDSPIWWNLFRIPNVYFALEREARQIDECEKIEHTLDGSPDAKFTAIVYYREIKKIIAEMEFEGDKYEVHWEMDNSTVHYPINLYNINGIVALNEVAFP